MAERTIEDRLKNIRSALALTKQFALISYEELADIDAIKAHIHRLEKVIEAMAQEISGRNMNNSVGDNMRVLSLIAQFTKQVEGK